MLPTPLLMGKLVPDRSIHPLSGPRYERSWRDWNSSSVDKGIVEVEVKKGSSAHQRTAAQKKEKQIHLWRAQGTLKDYICPGGKKRSDINDLIGRL